LLNVSVLQDALVVNFSLLKERFELRHVCCSLDEDTRCFAETVLYSAVKHYSANIVREKLRVLSAELRAIRQAELVHLLATGGYSHSLMVLCCGDSVEVVDDILCLLRTALS
jgi:hypothetical protein